MSKRPSKLWLLTEEEKIQLGLPRVVGVIPDIHEPFTIPDIIKEVVKTFKKNKVTDIVFIGDIVDLHTVSRFGVDPNGLSPLSEYEKALENLKKWYKEFPYAYYCIGNHDIRIGKVANSAGIPNRFIKSFRELYELPDTWLLSEFHIIGNVRYEHGLRVGGKDAAINTAILNMRSTVIGHFHSQAGVKYLNNGDSTIFGLSVGALTDDSAVAFSYGHFSKNKSLQGVGIVKSDKEAYFIPFKI